VIPAGVRDELARLDFHEAVFGRRRLYVAEEFAAHAQAINAQINGLVTPDCCSDVQASGNRRSALLLRIAGLPPLFVRRSRRGGLMRFLARDLYAGWAPRPLRELIVSATARRRGLPVADAIGAIVETAGPGLYRGWFLSRALDGVTLWNLLLGREHQLRAPALTQARASIDRMHDGGLYHADLNLHNLLVCAGGHPPRVVVLDLDKARLYPDALTPALRRANFHRLARSALRLSHSGAALSPAERVILGLF
jgi:hypothetical protein